MYFKKNCRRTFKLIDTFGGESPSLMASIKPLNSLFFYEQLKKDLLID